MTQDTALRALEALRAGVPNRLAVEMLGLHHAKVSADFERLLENLAQPHGDRGMLLSGGYGSGKSHALHYLANAAESKRFVVSKVVISKETVLWDRASVLVSAVKAMRVPDRVGSPIAELAERLKPDTSECRAFRDWLFRDSKLNGLFAASLEIFKAHQGDDEVRDEMVRFWEGGAPPTKAMKGWLKDMNQAKNFSFEKILAPELAAQRYRFISRLVKAAGYQGWVLLLDEVELIGRYPLGGRGKAYAEITRWLKGDPADRSAPFVAVLAISDDYDGEILDANGKNDALNVPARLRTKEATRALANEAEKGMDLLRRATQLQPANREVLDKTYGKLKTLHGAAYQWEPPDIEGLELAGSSTMRQFVRDWITRWDLLLLDPKYQPNMDLVRVKTDYSEDAQMETLSSEAEEDLPYVPVDETDELLSEF